MAITSLVAEMNNTNTHVLATATKAPKTISITQQRKPTLDEITISCIVGTTMQQQNERRQLYQNNHSTTYRSLIAPVEPLAKYGTLDRCA